jgi:hypothetical protein
MRRLAFTRTKGRYEKWMALRAVLRQQEVSCEERLAAINNEEEEEAVAKEERISSHQLRSWHINYVWLARGGENCKRYKRQEKTGRHLVNERCQQIFAEGSIAGTAETARAASVSRKTLHLAPAGAMLASPPAGRMPLRRSLIAPAL